MDAVCYEQESLSDMLPPSISQGFSKVVHAPCSFAFTLVSLESDRGACSGEAATRVSPHEAGAFLLGRRAACLRVCCWT